MNKRSSEKKAGNINEDLGLGTRVSAERIMNKDGSFYMERTGHSQFRFYEFYHKLIRMSWMRFFTIVLSAYLLENLLFATIYYLIGVQHLTGIDMRQDHLHQFLEAFFFSSQTLTTVGFGRIAPVGTITSSVAAIESMIGVLAFAVSTGLLYGRFSRPVAKLLYSREAIIAPYRDGSALMFRMTNLRSNQLIEVEVTITLAYFVKGATNRSFQKLRLERDKVSLFPTSWTIVHPIDDESPLYGAGMAEIRNMKAEILILVKAFDDTFSQTIYSRSSYHTDEILWGKKFLPMFTLAPDGKTIIDYRKIDDMEDKPVPVPEMVV